MADSFSLMSS